MDIIITQGSSAITQKHKRCSAITQKNKQCSNNAMSVAQGKYCKVHRNYISIGNDLNKDNNILPIDFCGTERFCGTNQTGIIDVERLFDIKIKERSELCIKTLTSLTESVMKTSIKNKTDWYDTLDSFMDGLKPYEESFE